ncbi:hypothetical protein OHR68_23695 [Spirillospora sp. NBC_00431]
MRRPRRAPWALAALLALTGLAPTGCGIRSTGVIGAGAPPSAHGYAATITLYLAKDGKLRPVTRPGVPGELVLALKQLAVPPTSQERAQGLRTEVHHPLDAYPVSYAERPEDGSTMIVMPSGDRSRARPWSRMAAAQITCTAEAFPDVERVRLWHGPNADEHGWADVRCDQFADLIG